MAGVQFYGIDALVKSYELRGIDTWALFQGKDLYCAGNDADTLKTFLERLNNAKDKYTLKVYNGVSDPDTITNKTECNGSWNFFLNEPGTVATIGNMQGAGVRGFDPIMQKIHGLISEEVSKSLDRRLNGDPDKEPTIKDIIMGYLEEPEKLVPVIGAIKSLFGGASVPMPLAAVAGIFDKPIQIPPTEQEIARLQNAITRLGHADPDIIKHLEQLATLAEQNPDKFKMALTLL